MRVIIREAAYNDLDRIYEWIAQDRPRSADTVVARILESAERLGRSPHMSHVGRKSGSYEWIIPGTPYILVYHVRENEELVLVDAIFHGAQNRPGEKTTITIDNVKIRLHLAVDSAGRATKQLGVRIAPAAQISRWTTRTDMKDILERAMGFEPTTPTLARLCSTPELHPHPQRGHTAKAS